MRILFPARRCHVRKLSPARRCHVRKLSPARRCHVTKLSSARRCEEIVYDQAVSCEEIASGQAVSCEEIVSGHAVPCEEIMFVCVFVCVCKFVFFSSTNDDSRNKALASPASPTYFSRCAQYTFCPSSSAGALNTRSTRVPRRRITHLCKCMCV